MLDEDSDDANIDFDIHIYKAHDVDEMSVKYSQKVEKNEENNVVHKCTIKYCQKSCSNRDAGEIEKKHSMDQLEVVSNVDKSCECSTNDEIKLEVDMDTKNLTERFCTVVSDQPPIESESFGTQLSKIDQKHDIEMTNDETINIPETSGNYDIVQLGELTKELKDVPLMANVDEVLVYHYKLELDVHFEEKCIDGNILLFTKPTNEKVVEKEFQMCLDCTLIDIQSVHEITLPDNFDIHFHNRSSRHKDIKPFHCDLKNPCQSCSFLQSYKSHLSDGLKYKTLSYAVYGWCIRVWKENSTEWPKCVFIKYRTKPIGPSLMWCTDSDGSPCTFTPGAYINNRSMMPCQEPPVAMSTWQASIQVPDGYVVLSSGDEVDKKQMLGEDLSNKFFFEMSLPLPSSTLAFAFGKFVRSSKVVPVLCSPNTSVVTVSLYASVSKIESFETEYLDLAVKYLKSACNILGKYPYTRVDLVLMPRSFACLGLESPNLTFLSQSVLCGDQSMSTRIAHEISHAWFGLLVGAKDWTEEWLSEGFATYIEDRILAHGLNLTEPQFDEYSYLMQILRYKTLKAEMDATEDDNLKRLRPIRKQSKTVVEAVNESLNDGDSSSPQAHVMIPNAAVASKKWSQVHYLKGYFLLHRMAKMVGLDSFDAFLRYYLEVHAGRLVTSEMFFNLFIEYYSLSLSVKDEILNHWMESTTVPIFEEQNPTTNSLVLLVQEETKFWRSSNITNKRFKTLGQKRKLDTCKMRPPLDSNQLVLLLENLLLVQDFAHHTLTQMNQVYRFKHRNGEVRHRWCELIIKHLYILRYDDVKRFLIEDQGMGIYLFAELVITNNPRQKNLAISVFDIIKDEMDRSTFTTVNEILYGSDETN